MNGNVTLTECVGPCCSSKIWDRCMSHGSGLTKAEKKKYFEYLKKKNLFWKILLQTG